MTKQLTIGIPTCGRSKKLRECVASCRDNVSLDHDIIVVDSGITNEARRFYDGVPNLRHVGFEEPIGPAAARKIIAERTETPYLLYLDDDNWVPAGCAERLFVHLEARAEVDIGSGVLREYGAYRALGHRFNFGTVGDRRFVHRTVLAVQDFIDLGATSVRTDLTMNTMMVRTRIFDRVQFDVAYDFYYELLDFFMQCHREGIVCEVLPDAVFEHRPTPYRGYSLRYVSKMADGERVFAEKWGIQPIGPQGGYRQNLLRRLTMVCRTAVRKRTLALKRRTRSG